MRNEWIPGFKVVRCRYSGRFESATDMGRTKTYYQGFVNSPDEGCGPLAVFTKVSDAEAFISTFSGMWVYHILPCAYLPSKRYSLWETMISMDGDGPFINRMYLDECPDGTRLASAVFLFA